MNQINNDLILCLRAALLSERVCCDVENCIPLAQRHGVTHLLYYAVNLLPPEQRPGDELCGLLKRKTYGAVLREAAQQQKLDELYRRMEASQIRCVALKGIVLKAAYPKPELRYMADIDILIDPNDAEKLRRHFEEMGCRVLNFDQGETDLYVSPEGLTFEIKRTLRSESFNPATEVFLDKLLSIAKPLPDYRYVSSLPNEEHYAYVLCHMVKHLLNGGVGVRPVMDVWICKNNLQMDEIRLKRLLAELKLTDFAEKIEHLASVWFSDAEKTPLDEELGEYILNSGAFGSEEHRVADRMIHRKNGTNRVTYVLTRLFPPYRTMRYYYPILRSWAVLLPIFWIWRMIYAVIFRRGKLAEEVGAIGEANSQMLEQRIAFYGRCGINISEK